MCQCLQGTTTSLQLTKEKGGWGAVYDLTVNVKSLAKQTTMPFGI